MEEARTRQKYFVILTMDGGGVRGIVPSLILNNLDQKLKGARRLRGLPMNHWTLPSCFDLIGGTSTGGIIALALGQLHLPTEELLAMYREVPALVFPDAWGGAYKWLRLMHNGSFYDKNNLKEKLETYAGGESMVIGTGQPLVFVVTRDESTNPPEGHLFRNYDAPIYSSIQGCVGVGVVDAALATSAAPVVFEPHQIRFPSGAIKRFSDGGLTANNPTKLAWKELKDFQRSYEKGGGRSLEFEVVIISIGTGVCPIELKKSNENTWFRGVRDHFERFEEFVTILANTESTNEEVTRDANEMKGANVNLFRFNPVIQKTSGFTNDADVLNYLETVTNKYLSSEEVIQRMMKVVEKIIDHEQTKKLGAVSAEDKYVE